MVISNDTIKSIACDLLYHFRDIAVIILVENRDTPPAFSAIGIGDPFKCLNDVTRKIRL